MSNVKYIIDRRGNKRWYNEKGEFHREDGPAVEDISGWKEWRINDKRHRLDGPAIELTNGEKKWFIDGEQYSEKQFPIAVIMYSLGCNEETAKLVLEQIKSSKLCQTPNVKLANMAQSVGSKITINFFIEKMVQLLSILTAAKNGSLMVFATAWTDLLLNGILAYMAMMV
jgi:hypothetical protein